MVFDAYANILANNAQMQNAQMQDAAKLVITCFGK